jgi:hypothetical protein
MTAGSTVTYAQSDNSEATETAPVDVVASELIERARDSEAVQATFTHRVNTHCGE